MFDNITSTPQALMAAERILAASPAPDTVWRSYAIAPLAAILLALARARGGRVESGLVRELVSPGTVCGRDQGPVTAWLSLASWCPDSRLADYLRGAAHLSTPQRTSVQLTMLAALAGP